MVKQMGLIDLHPKKLKERKEFKAKYSDNQGKDYLMNPQICKHL